MEKSLLMDLCNSLNIRGGAILAFPVPEMFELLEELFTEEEARLAAKMPAVAISAEDLAQSVSEPVETVHSLLEAMADKGTVLDRQKDGVTLYKLLPILPGIFEWQFMAGRDTERHRRLARLFKDYIELAEGKMKELMPIPDDMTSLARVIPIEKSIEAGQKVYTFDQLSRYIESATAISVGHCFCRHQAYLLGETTCDVPEESCMSFGPGAEYVIRRKIGRAVTKEEAHDILRKCEQKGLVHLTSNTSNFLEFLCNCCGCHCGTLQKIKETRHAIYGASSGYLAEVDSEQCDGCETCVEHCQLEAVSMGEDDTAHVDEAYCLGCGACASLCPSEAITMVPREGAKEPPATARDLRQAIMKDLQRGQAGR